MSNFKKSLDNYFKIGEKGSTIRTEIIAGLTTFMTMVYILPVNAGMFSGAGWLGVSFGAIYITTAIAAIIGTLLMALYAKLPFAQATGMGLNAFFCFTVCMPIAFGGSYGFTYANALVIILASGILFTCLTIGGIREKIVKAVPTAVRLAIPAGIGLFIAFIGLQDAGIIISDAQLMESISGPFVSSATIVKLFSMKLTGSNANTFASLLPMFVTLVTVFGIAALAKLKVKGSILWGILGGSVVFVILALIFNAPVTLKGTDYAGLIGSGSNYYLNTALQNPITAFSDFGTQSFGKVFTEGFTGLFGSIDAVISFIAVFISFAMVDMFDTIGTLLGTASRANMLDENGEVPNMKKALLCDSVATMAGSILGTSTVTTFVESAAGVAEGGRTGLTSLVVAVLFFAAMFLSPIAQLIPMCATSAALIYVGVLMMGGVKNIDWEDAASAVPAFLTIIMMAFTYNISYGIGFGFISYVAIKLFTGKVKDIHPITAVLALLFLANFFFVTH